MRHQVFGRHLNRDIKERKALFRSLIASLIIHGRIKTTVAKAKAIRGLAEKLVTQAKEGTTSSVRRLTSFLTKKEISDKLITKIAPLFKERFGGYLRIRRIGQRQGDRSEEVFLEWTAQEKKKEPVKPVKLEKKEVAVNKEKKA